MKDVNGKVIVDKMALYDSKTGILKEYYKPMKECQIHWTDYFKCVIAITIGAAIEYAMIVKLGLQV